MLILFDNIQRPNNEVFRNITYPDFWRKYTYARVKDNPLAEEGEPDDDESRVTKDTWIDREQRTIYRRRKQAIIRWPFLTPYGDDVEKYCLKRLLEKIAVPICDDLNEWTREFKTEETWLKECCVRDIWDKEEIGKDFLDHSYRMGHTEYDLRSIANTLIEGNFLTHAIFQEYFDTHNLQDICDPAAMEDDEDVIQDAYPGPRLELLPLDTYIEQFTNDQRQVFDYIRHKIANKEQVLATIVGAAGVGKSHLIKAFCALFKMKGEEFSKTNKSFHVLAPTGTAAYNVKGKTYHSFFKFDTKYVSHIRKNTMEEFFIKCCDVIIIDEMSMIDAKAFREIETVMRKWQTGGDRYKLFGGKHVILVGDPAQLPARNQPWFDGEFFPRFTIFTLKQLVRQQDDQFGRMLNKARVGNMTKDVIQFFNNQWNPELNPETILQGNLTVVVSLCKQVDDINQKILNLIPGEAVEFHAEDTDLAGNPLSDNDKKRLMEKNETYG